MISTFQNFIGFFRREAVLTIAVILALFSAFVIPPGDGNYAGYVDWNTLALLFGLMTVMKGFQNAGLFDYLGGCLLNKISNSKQMLLVLVFLPFLCSMVITNDVALITFVPFAMVVLKMAKQEKLLVPLVVFQTLAANLGSMLTPMGNPQNLYLYTKSGISFLAFCKLMLPYVLASAACLLLMIAAGKKENVSGVSLKTELKTDRHLYLYTAGFLLCLLSVFKMISPLISAAVIGTVFFLTDRKLLKEVDYSLLGTFVAFFIFIGNTGCIGAFREFLSAILSGHEMIAGVFASQVISNVPAALLLSGFTDSYRELIVGCNLGGLGTLIASMASLISYKMVVREYPDQRKKYFCTFTVCNIGMLAVLLLPELL